MSTEVQWRGGTTAQHAAFTGLAREITVDTTKKTAVVHDGVTPGGFPLALEGDGISVATAIHAAAAKTTPADGDELPIADSAASYALKKLLWSTVKLWTVPAGHIFGLTLSNNVSDATNDIDVAAGEAASEGDSVPLRITLASAMTKRLDANWAAGTNQGGRYSGAAITNTTYHVWLVSKALGADPDVYLDPSAVKATVLGHLQAETGGSAYAHARRVGSILRESGAIVPFLHVGRDIFLRVTPVTTIAANDPGTSAVTRTMKVPTGIAVIGLFNLNLENTTGGFACAANLTPLAAADVTPDGPFADAIASFASGFAGYNFAWREVLTNTSAQIRSRLSGTSSSNVTLRISDFGWRDHTL